MFRFDGTLYCLMLLSTFRCELTFNAINMSVREREEKKNKWEAYEKKHTSREKKRSKRLIHLYVSKRYLCIYERWKWSESSIREDGLSERHSEKATLDTWISDGLKVNAKC